MKSTNFYFFSFLLFFFFFNCKTKNNNESDKNNSIEVDSTKTVSEYGEGIENSEDANPSYVTLKMEPDGRLSYLVILDNTGYSLKYDDEIDYAELYPIKQFFMADKINLEKYYKDTFNKKSKVVKSDGFDTGYSNEYIDFFNSKINLVYELPLKTEDEKLNEVFNRVYYDYIEYDVYKGDKKYGEETFYLSKDGTVEYRRGYFGGKEISNPNIKLKRDDKTGNITISKY
ncbi:hypothetical protein HXZ94_08430 [Empedobacter falsenii]|uniref:hypothetical protein n=1 Tax=Empedobacter falsenii TaxID=343874 RepID=UPI0025789955|nr:hypothetical protein [Empedobacter falsenii]MDM1298527.1 hypothetical protein [Empedobacter falsenii]MDM1318320.1 hypothetical protein [Empedobacter falsenii]